MRRYQPPSTHRMSAISAKPSAHEASETQPFVCCSGLCQQPRRAGRWSSAAAEGQWQHTERDAPVSAAASPGDPVVEREASWLADRRVRQISLADERHSQPKVDLPVKGGEGVWFG
mmetsp:Transcript_22947/g.65636  ORF Transcript_22947/g.65636 Transcript_22947/m.65636 type:complete len:116 (+) Transcript_22947:989-1336(+)